MLLVASSSVGEGLEVCAYALAESVSAKRRIAIYVGIFID